MQKIVLSILIVSAMYSMAVKAQNPTLLWKTDAVLSGPESVVYDAKRDLLYVSNMRSQRENDIYYNNDFISKVSMSGKIVDLHWIPNITEPTGITIHDDCLYIVERFGVAVYDLKKDTIDRRIKINAGGFLNDITISPEGVMYVSESSTNKIYSIINDTVSVWAESEKIARPNGILYDNGKVLIAANRDSAIMVIDAETKTIRKMVQMNKGIIDGIKKIDNDYLVSFLEGNLYRVTVNGEVTEILNTRGKEIGIADFEYIEDKKMLFAPSIWQHNLVAFKLK